jgi:cytochrome c biogenesis protein CcmG/thiol:disulfide interchange protein DsbE
MSGDKTTPPVTPSPEEREPRHPSELEASSVTRRRRQRRWLLIGGVAASISLLTLLLSFGLRHDPTVLKPVLIGKRAPEFSLPTLDGTRTLKLSDLRGQVVVVNFWASWCLDCRVEHPALEAAWHRYRDQGVVFVGISFNDGTSAARAYAREMGGDWPLLLDPSSSAALGFGVSGVPETFVISRDGQIAYKQFGAVDYALLTDQMSRLLGGSAPK